MEVPVVDEFVPDALVERAIGDTGLDDLGDPTFRDGLEVLCGALEDEATLSPLGRVIADAQLVGLLRTRLRVQDWVQNHDELATERVDRPIFLVGMSRSGTTALSHILARDPGNRSLLAWEATDPVPPPAPHSRNDDPRAIAARDAGPTLIEQLNPGFAAMHHDPWDLPIECVVVMAQHFVSLQFSPMYFVPTYTRWVVGADHSPVYRWHDQVLRVLQSGGERGRWQLKSPHHGLAIDDLAEQHPDALFVVTHRDPVECVASTASLARSLAGTFSSTAVDDTARSVANGDLYADLLFEIADRTMAARDRLGEHRFVDIAYRDVKERPVEAVRQIYRALGNDLAPSTEGLLRAHAEVAVPNRHGRHDYDAADFGIDPGALRERFATYRSRFAAYL